MLSSKRICLRGLVRVCMRSAVCGLLVVLISFPVLCVTESAEHGRTSDGKARGDVSKLRRGRAESYSHHFQVSRGNGFSCQSCRRAKGM